MSINIKKLFDFQGIEIPFPHRTLYTGIVTESLPISLIKRKHEIEAKFAVASMVYNYVV